MKASHGLMAAAIVVLLSNTETAMPQDRAADGEERQVVEALAGFSAALYRQTAGAGSNNFLISPLSVHLVLAALGAGADAGTKAELQRVLQMEDLAAAGGRYRVLLNKLNNPPKVDNSPAYTLALADAAWIKQDYPIKNSFRDMLQHDFDAQLSAIDFSKPARAAAEINKWVEDKTAQRIKDLISEASIAPLTRLILTNAVYFKSRWQNQFEKQVTKEAPFYAGPARTVQVQMMNDIQTVPYHEDGEVQVLSLPYFGRTLSMVIILPRDRFGLNDVERSLNAGSIEQWLEKQKPVRTDYHVPRFSFSGRLQLNEALKALGLKEAFDQEKASFPGITEQEKLWLSLVLHQGFIDVDEEGTEAAAATAVVMLGSAFPTGEPQEFRADHPFMFAIIHEPTKAILFMGRVSDPAAK